MKRILVAGVSILVACVAGGLIWLNYLRPQGPDEFSLSSTSSLPVSTTVDADKPNFLIDGEWAISEDSEAGYRVVEDLKGVNNFEAVGRTDQVTGSMSVEGTLITAASIEIDVSSIQSDDTHRDGHFREEKVMNANKFPTATFTLTKPAYFGQIPSAGQLITTTIIGDLTLKGVTKQVSIDIESQIVDSQIEAVGSVEINFDDYGIANPSNALVAVRNQGKIEFKLFFSQQ